MGKEDVFFCDVIIKNKKNPNIIAILRLARNIDSSGFEISRIIKEVEENEEIMKVLPELRNDFLNASRWNLFCRTHVLKKFQQYGFYERIRKYIWTSVFEI